ncbi:MAG: DNA polymerase III subunit delta' [Actinomycetota bacterium]|nr:DNA polymerase III subunit delta' [Actinomycetota bacterium]
MKTTTPGMWNRLLGQEAAVGVLRASLASDRVGHAYLFVGPRGVGRAPAALALAASVNCLDDGCGTCAICAKVLRRSHADVHHISAEGGQIVVDQVRALREEASRAPFEGRMKVFIIDEAERLNPAAGNALLKVLEEPPSSALFILMTDAPDDMLPTVVSRCRRIDFVPLGFTEIVEILTQHHGVAEDRAAWAASAGGNLAAALRLSKDPAAEERRERHLSYPERLARAGLSSAISLAGEVRVEADEAVDRLKVRQKDEIKEHAEAYGEARGTAAARKRLEVRHKREARRTEQQTYEIVLTDLAAWYRGALLARHGDGAPDAQIEAALGDCALSAPTTSFVDALERIEATRVALSRNAQAGLALEALFMHLGSIG